MIRNCEYCCRCTCGFCINSNIAAENFCCKEKMKVVSKIFDYNANYGGNIDCIIEHPGFNSNCLDVWVLENVYIHYAKQVRRNANNADAINEKYRYTAYRQLVRWCWRFLGHEVRVPLPSCALHKIRSTFQSGNIVGFRYPPLN